MKKIHFPDNIAQRYYQPTVPAKKQETLWLCSISLKGGSWV